ncbi:restriction endonuclease [Candidatus Eisenbacteria bacterium]|uniref:Restriction endonuclease n=1 Tax=Eiseniibacteriota bacterium TaxID=2212470 RepID=A0ABV6YJU4_UNCEI
MTTPSENYEQFTQRVIGSLVGVDVHRGHIYTGRVSKRQIKVDVSFAYSIANGANVLFIVECKCYNRRVPVDDVEEFHSKLDDIGAHKGIMVTTVGFQRGAIETARGRGIALALLTSEFQPGELRYVVNATTTAKPGRDGGQFWQGNLRGPRSNYDGGFRFEGIGQFLGLLCLDAVEEQRQKGIAAWEREHGGG